MSKRKHDDDCASVDNNDVPSKKTNIQLTSYVQSDIVTILVGPEEAPFPIHKDLLAARSPYFASQFKVQWNSNGDNQFKLPNFKPYWFKFIVGWIYTGTIEVDLLVLDEEDGQEPWSGWIELYHYADFLLMSDCQNRMVDMDLAHTNARGRRPAWAWSHACHWYHFGLQGTPYFKLFLDECVMDHKSEECTSETIEEFEKHVRWMEEYPGLQGDVLLHMDLYDFKQWSGVTTGDPCRYHIHAHGERCELGGDIEAGNGHDS